LVSKGDLKPLTFKADVFDAATTAATRRFQKKKGAVANYSLPTTGCVNFATYHKAVQEGMPPYHPIRVKSSCAMEPGPTTRTHDQFRDNKNNTTGKKGLGLTCVQSGSWHDVSDWQSFLNANGYLATGDYVAGNFNGNTQSATAQFQMIWVTSTTANGYVNHATWAVASDFATVTNGLGVSLVGADSGVTVENTGSCP
jgi:hypothetical protein